MHKITGSYSFRIAVAGVVVAGAAAGGFVALAVPPPQSPYRVRPRA